MGRDLVVESLSTRVGIILDEVNIKISSKEAGFFGFGYRVEGFLKKFFLKIRNGGGRMTIDTSNEKVFFWGFLISMKMD